MLTASSTLGRMFPGIAHTNGGNNNNKDRRATLMSYQQSEKGK